MCVCERERETDRQTDRQINRQNVFVEGVGEGIKKTGLV